MAKALSDKELREIFANSDSSNSYLPSENEDEAIPDVECDFNSNEQPMHYYVKLRKIFTFLYVHLFHLLSVHHTVLYLI